MKSLILTIAMAFFIAGAMLTSCNSPAEKVDNAKKDVIEEQKELDKAKADLAAEMANYRTETSVRMATNDQMIADLRLRIDKEKKETRAAFKQKIDELEQKNNEIKSKLDNYKWETRDDWERFKTEFNHDMDQLGEGFKSLTKDNVK